MKETIMVFCAHNDDQVIGCGGTLAKFAQEKKCIISVIFSYGASSHPWLIPKGIIETRVKENKKADRILGIKESIYFGMKEGNFLGAAKKRHTSKTIKELLDKYRPSKIFTHSPDDPHPDHSAVYRTVINAVDSIKIHYDVYTFSIWNPIKLFTRNNPKLVVDIKDTLQRKIMAFKIHKSQKLALISLLWGVYLRAIFHGFSFNLRYAEVFYKVR
jgi:LmbE family N-acetylglucosaminyl deacetylase